MVEILRSPVAVHLPLYRLDSQYHSYPESKLCLQCVHSNLDFGFVKWRKNQKDAMVHVQKVGSVNRLVLFGSIRTKVNRDIVNCFENGLVNNEQEEEDISIPMNEEETLGVSIDKKLPPWGILDIEVDGSLESREDCIPSNSGRVSCNLEPRLHFLEERDEDILSKRVLSLSRTNKVRSAFDLFMSMEFSGLQPNLHACNSLISSLLRNEFLDEALRVFELMKKKEMTTGHTYSLILKAVSSIQGSDSALKMFTELEGESRRRKDFDVIVYNTMISICGKANNWVQTEKMWKILKEDGHQATTVTYDLLISTFIRCGQSELALDAYKEMIENELKPSEDMMQAIISASTKEGNWSMALNVFKGMLESGLSPNIIAYNSLINSLGKAGEIELAFWVFDLMQSSGHKPDVYTWNALLSSLYRGGRYSDALRLFESIKRKHNSQLNSHLYNTALMSCQRLSLWDRSLQLLWQMEASGLAVSTASYNLVIEACEVARKPKVALQVYEHMVHKDCTPNTFTYLSLIRSCVWGSLWPEVEEILDSVTPDVSLYNAAIHGMCLQGKLSIAKKLYMKMRDNGLKPDGKTRALMLQNLKRDSVRPRNRWMQRNQSLCTLLPN